MTNFMGEEGDDVISCGLGTNAINGGPGSDTVIYGGDAILQIGIDVKFKVRFFIHKMM